MRRRYHRLKFLRLAGLTALAALVSLGGLFSFFGSAGFLAPVTALADSSRGQTAVAEPGLFFRSTDKAFYSVGENTSAHGPLIQNQSAGAPCFQYALDAMGDSGPDGKKNRAAVDRFGNFYIASKFSSEGVLSVNVDRVSSDCSSSTGFFNLSHMKNLGGERAADPDVAYSFGDKRIYVAMELDPGDAVVYSAPTEDANGNPLTTGWNSSSRWTLETRFSGQGIRPINVRIAADRKGGVHMISRSSGGKTVAVADKINGSWNTYGGNGKVISSSSDGGWNVSGLAISAARDGTTYATWVSHPGPVSIGMARFDPVSNTWSFISENVTGANVGDYLGVTTDSVTAGLNNQSVFIAIGATTGSSGSSCVYLYSSNARGNAGSFSRQTVNCYSDTATVVSIAQGANRVGIIVKDDPFRQNYYYERSPLGGTGQIVSAVNPLSSPITIPTGQTSVTFPVSWHWIDGGTSGTSSGVNFNLQYSVNGGAWQNFGTDPTITSSVGFPTAATSANISVDMTAKAYPLSLKFRSLGSDADPANNEDQIQAALNAQAVSLVYPQLATTMTALAATTTTNSFNINWAGSGGKTLTPTFRVDVQDDNGAWNTCLASTTNTSLSYPAGCTAATYHALSGHTYNFRVSATDGVVNTFSASATAQASTHIVFPISGFSASVPAAVATGTTSVGVALTGKNGDVNPNAFYAGKLLPGLKYTIQYRDLTSGNGWVTANPVQTNAVLDANGLDTDSNGTFNLGGLQNGHTYQIRVTATDGTTTTPATDLTTTVLTGSPVGTVYNNCAVVRVNAVQTLGAAFTNFELSNDGASWSQPYTYNDNQTNVLWNLADPQYGGPGTGLSGARQVFIRYSTNGGGSWGGPTVITNVITNSTSFTPANCTNFTNPRSTPLGDTNGSNQEFISFYNPGNQDVGVFLTYYQTGGSPTLTDKSYVVKANGHLSVNVNADITNSHGVTVKSDGTVNIEQETYANNGANGIDGMAVDGNADTTWFFPDSSFDGRTIGYDVFNPSNAAVNVSLQFVDPLGNPVGAAINMSVNSGRQQLFSSNSSGVSGFVVAAKITANSPIIASQSFTSGSRYATALGLADNTTNTAWYFPTMNATSGNTTNISVWNQQNKDITLTFTFYQPNGGSVVKVSRVIGAGRMLVYPLSNLISSVPGVNITNLRQAMVSVTSKDAFLATMLQSNGASMSSVRGIGLSNSWKIADSPAAAVLGGLGTANDTIYLANFSNTTAMVTLGAYDDNGVQQCTTGCVLTIPAYQRVVVSTASLGINNKRVSILIQATGSANPMLAVVHSQDLGGDKSLIEAQP